MRSPDSSASLPAVRKESSARHFRIPLNNGRVGVVKYFAFHKLPISANVGSAS